MTADAIREHEHVLNVSNVRFRYGDRPVFERVSFSLHPSEFSGIIGSNGTGKSTLLQLLLGERVPETGHVTWFGTPVPSFRQWHRIGYVPQHGLAQLGAFPATAEEIVISGLYRSVRPLRLPGRRHRRLAREALARVGMDHAAGSLIGQLSGGQRQRVLLARVLAARPDVMLLDEPLTGIDRETSDQIYELLGRLSHDDGLTILMVTHDISRAARHLDRIFCLDDQTMVEVAHDQIEHELMHRHRHPVPELTPEDGTIESIPALAPACGWPDPTRGGTEDPDGTV